MSATDPRNVAAVLDEQSRRDAFAAEIDRRDAERRDDEVWSQFAACALTVSGGWLRDERDAREAATLAACAADALMAERRKRATK